MRVSINYNSILIFGWNYPLNNFLEGKKISILFFHQAHSGEKCSFHTLYQVYSSKPSGTHLLQGTND